MRSMPVSIDIDRASLPDWPYPRGNGQSGQNVNNKAIAKDRDARSTIDRSMHSYSSFFKSQVIHR